jgi:SAM-dependent methyltransferase
MPDLSRRSAQPELMDDLTLDSDALRQNLEELETINTRLGGYAVVLGALRRLYARGVLARGEAAHLVDIGSGGGDTLRAIYHWAARWRLPVRLAGVDANPFMIGFATERARAYPGIEFHQADIFGPEFASFTADVFVCSLFCHHFTDDQLVPLLTRLHRQARRAVVINDLHRHWLAYWSIHWLTRLLGGSYLVRHDAPLSVWRAFTRRELHQLMARCGFAHYELRWCWAFRWQLVIYPNG